MIDVRFEKAGLQKGRAELGRFAREVLGAAMADLRWEGAGLSVLFCSDARMRALNLEFRHIDKATDVLSFPNADDAEELRGEPEPYLGDLAIALPYTARQAAEHGRAVADEVALLLAHGLLHLLGWDHDTEDREKAMWAETDRLLALSKHLLRPYFSDLESR
ncbi:rRNA maturation RNase YbeY [bacterium]|nr:rRNA maturation RNase YbeY [bacterium]